MSISRRTRLAPLAAGDLEQPAVEVERLLGVEELVQVRLFGQIADPLVLRHVRRGLAENQRVALGRKQKPEQQLDRRRLARPVRAQQTENLAPMDLEVKRLERQNLRPAPEIAVNLGQVSRLDDDVWAHQNGASALCRKRAWSNPRLPGPAG